MHKVSCLSGQWIHMLQGVGEDGENMRNLLFSVFSRFSLLLPILSPTPEEINPHSFGFSMQTWEEIPTVSVLLAGNRARSMGSLVSHTPWVCVRDAPAEPAPSTARLRDQGTPLIFVQTCPIPLTLHLMICQLSSSLQKPWRCLHFFPTITLAGDSWVSKQSLAKGFRVTLCGAQNLCFAAPLQQRLAPTCHPWEPAGPCGTHLLPQAHTSAAVTTRYWNRN